MPDNMTQVTVEDVKAAHLAAINRIAKDCLDAIGMIERACEGREDSG